MSYINSYGQSVGPISIDTTWLSTRAIPVYTNKDESQKYNYICFSYNKNFSTTDTDQLAPLYARTPSWGSYINEENKLVPCAPLNSVATIQWVMEYASLSPGEQPGFDVNDFVTINQLQNAKDELNSKIATNTRNISINASNISKNTIEINNIKENPFPNGLWLMCGGA